MSVWLVVEVVVGSLIVEGSLVLSMHEIGPEGHYTVNH